MSTLEVSNLNDGTTTVATTYITNGSAKAWGVVRQTGTMALYDSLNLSSITDTGTGSTSYAYSNNFDVANNYSCCTGTSNDNNFCGEVTGRSASNTQLNSNQHDGTVEDSNHQSMSVFGDLA